MLDHTYKGVPIRQLPRKEILACLTSNLEILSNPEGIRDPVAWIKLRLEIELIIRALLGETH